MGLDSNMSFLFKGPFGHSKTCSAATFALDGPVYISYWDKKKPVELDHFFRRIIRRPDLLSRINYEVFGAHNAHEYLNKMIELAKDCRFFAIVNDSVTNMTSGAVNWSLSFRDDRKNKDKLKVIPDWDEYKVETSLTTQALDICRGLPCHVIWTCHPIPGIKIEGQGASVKVTKTNPIVTYGSKVAGIVPGNFSEIYHFSKLSTWDSGSGSSAVKYLVDTDVVGDDFAKSNIGLSGQMDITNRLFYEVWKEKVRLMKEEMNALKQEQETTAINPINPFSNPSINQQPPQTQKKW